MSTLLELPKVEVFVGDGFKFLANKLSYDVIITDSSDAVGPVASLFLFRFFFANFRFFFSGHSATTDTAALGRTTDGHNDDDSWQGPAGHTSYRCGSLSPFLTASLSLEGH